MVAAVVARELIVSPVERKAAAGDAVGVAADGDSEVWMRTAIVFGVIESQHDIAHDAVPVADAN
jgi:hypothetical protein